MYRVSNFVVGTIVYVTLFLEGGLFATGVVAATLFLPYPFKAYDDVKSKRDAEERS